MTAKEFIIWFRGFSKAANGYNVTPRQWEDIQSKLQTVDLNDDNSVLNRYMLDANEHRTNTTANIFHKETKQQLND
jgi:hypothetical protein